MTLSTAYPFLNGDGEMARLTRQYDWSVTPLGLPDQWPVSLRTLVNMMLSSRFPMLIFWGPELITFYNDAFRPSLGDNGKHPSSLAQRGEQSWAESWPVIGPMIYNIMAGGDAVWFEDQKLPIYRDGQLGYAYWTYSFSPIIDDNGAINGVLVTCSETTTGVESLQQLNETNAELRQSLEQNILLQRQTADSEARFRSLIEEAPIGTCLYVGPQMRIDIANKIMLEYWGKGNSVLGKTMREAIPELHDQPFPDLLDEVFATGSTIEQKAARAELVVNGVPGTYYFDFTYKPLCDSTGQVYAVLDVAIDVTAQVVARQRLEEAESSLRVAVELAQLGTWSIDVATNVLTYSDRIIDWFGYEPQDQSYSQVIPILVDADQDRVAEAIAWALKPESGGIYNETYTVINARTGQRRILHAQGKTVFDTSGRAIRLNGTAQDVTIERELQLALENEVRLRTQELATINEELATNNHELAEANRLLNQSNESLQQFAYVASHDLQEPLRKIRSFGSLLLNQTTSPLDPISQSYLNRMVVAGERMSHLINDLLTYSRVATQQHAFTTVSLQAILDDVLATLDMTIEQSNAQLDIDSLPVVYGDQMQLSQLFQNLLTNALKFTQPGQSPVIHVESRIVDRSELSPGVQPTSPAARFHQISVHDQGVGFEARYVDRIFQVFQRLHNKEKYPGTGIGLAICQRVVENHGGGITATSELGRGATFCVFLPVQP